MSKVKGGQLENSTISQSNMSIQTNTILSGTSITNKEYLFQQINEKAGGIHQSSLNQHMVANVATVGQLACNTNVIEFPIGTTLVKINGTQVNVGIGLDCYFSPDNITIRINNNAQKGDYLYWNSSKYNLDTNDEIDFNYLVASDYISLSSGTTVTLNPIYNSLVVKYTGESGTSMTVIIDGVSILVGNSGGSFVWDIGGLNHIFNNINESIIVLINGNNYTIWFDGFGSLIYSVKKGGEISTDPIFKFEIQTTGSTQSIIIPHLSGYTHNYIIDYGDGTINDVTTYNSTGCTHIYTNPGTYTIKISGTCETFYINNTSNMKLLIKKILQWGNIGIKVMNFYGCRNLVAIDNNARYLNNMTNFISIFRECISLTTIPIGLFDYCTGVTSFQFAFSGTSIKSIPNGLFDKCVEVTNFDRIFMECYSLTTIPINLFRYNVKTTSFQGIFWSCTGITSIPTDMFKYNINVINLGYLFFNCLKITSIPSGLFDNCTGVTSFARTFTSCQITSIPSDLFKNCPNVITFFDTFATCPITTIPSGLFDSCTKITNFRGVFYLCTSLTTIPVGLLNNCTEITSFVWTFNSCPSLISIPIGLFDHCTKVTTFSYTFSGCTTLTSIPIGLFDYCTGVTIFQGTFMDCTSLDGNAPTLWTRTNPTPSGTQCFTNDFGLDNYSSIPSNWKT